jgi:K+-sensing histidine kinase KdpD
MDWAGVITATVSAAGGFLGGVLTRRTAKESAAATREASAVTGFAELTEKLQDQSDRQERRIAGLEKRERLRRRQAREHETWDRLLVARLNELTKEPFPPPPPLEPEET